MRNGISFLFAVLVVCAQLHVVNTSCPSTCICKDISEGFFVNCTLKSFGYIPVLPNDTYSLDLSYNVIEHIPSKAFSNLTSLESLYLHTYKITDIPRDTFNNLSRLKTLYLNINQIRCIESNAFVKMVNLYYLNLQNNEISTIKQSAFVNLPSLRTLYLNNNKIKSIESNAFVNLTNLYEMHLYNNEISTIKQFVFINLPSLRNLFLSSNDIASIGEYTFVNLPSLFNLDLRANNISLIEEYALENLTQLSTLNLALNPLNCDCSIFPFVSWITDRPSHGISAKCSDGTFVSSLKFSELAKCIPSYCRCLNGGKCITGDDGKVVCQCIGRWSGKFCQESQCMTYDCGFGNCLVEPINGTAQCVYDTKKPTFCPGKHFKFR